MYEHGKDLPANLALAVGRLAGAFEMAPDATRAAAAVRRLQVAWDTYLRDAEAGDAGPEHGVAEGSLLASHDPRRDGVLLWLASHGAPPIATAAQLAVQAVCAERRLPAVDLELLAIAVDRLPPVLDAPTMADIHTWIWSYVDALWQDPQFAEEKGETYVLACPGHRYEGWRSAEPSGCWAANLALTSRQMVSGIPLPAGLLSREIFRLDLDLQERQVALYANWRHAVEREQAAVFDVHRALAKGEAALAGLSKNARARDGWALIVAFVDVRRSQLMRILDLSRAGAWLIVGQLADSELVHVGRDGQISI